MGIKTIEKNLEQFELTSSGKFGLYQGKTGVCLANFLLYKETEDKAILAKAKALLVEIGENVVNVNQYNFADGLYGIGWTIEWLVQNKFVKANTDMILEDLDDELYKNLIFSNQADLSLPGGLTGKGHYFHYRMISRNRNTIRYKNIYHGECLAMILDLIRAAIVAFEVKFVADRIIPESFQLEAIGHALFLFGEVFSSGVDLSFYQESLLSIVGIANEIVNRESLWTDDVAFETAYFLYAYQSLRNKLKFDIDERLKNHILPSIVLNPKINIQDFYQRHLYQQIWRSCSLDFTSPFADQDSHEKNTIFDLLVDISRLSNQTNPSWRTAWGLN